MEKTQFIVQIQLQGNNVDKVISVGVSPDEFENINRADKIGMKLIKRVEIIRETTLVSQVEQRVAQPQSSTVEPPQPYRDQSGTQPPPTITEPITEQTFSSKFGKPTEPTVPTQPSDDDIDKMITKPNEANP